MRHLRPNDYKIMPWKNGGGTTTEIAIFLNLMVRRGGARGEVEVIAMPEALGIACPAGGWLIVHVLTGNLNRASAGDTLLADHDVNLAASDEPALITVARIGKTENSTWPG